MAQGSDGANVPIAANPFDPGSPAQQGPQPPFYLASGAGHDAMVMAELCDIGMLFLRCAGGISHNPAESVTVEDVAWAYTVLLHTLNQLAQDYG